MSKSESWEPLSFEDERFKIYPDQFHIFENYGKPDSEELNKNILTTTDLNHKKSVKDFKQKEINIGSDIVSNKYSKNFDESEDEFEIQRLKQEKDENEKIRSMRNIGILPAKDSYLNSKKTAPCILSGTTNLKKSHPIILDEHFFKFSPVSTDSNSTNEKNSTVSDSIDSILSTSSDSSGSEFKRKPKSIYDVLQAAKIPPLPKVKKPTYKEQYPSLTEIKKNSKKKF